MKDTIIKTITLLIGFGLLVYVGWLFIQWTVVTAAGDQGWTVFALALSLFVALFFIAVALAPRLIPMNRWHLLLFGVLIILGAGYWLKDKPEQQVFLADIMKLVGVYLVITGPTRMLIPKKVQEAIEEEKMEVIEV